MIELLLVIAIMMLVSVLAIPSMIRSYRGARLRTSARTVLMAHRQARASAVLRQTKMAILFDTERSLLEVVSLTSTASTADRAMFLESRASRLQTEVEGGDAQPVSETVGSELIRRLADQVRMTEFNIVNGPPDEDGIYYVEYLPNGMCNEYSMRLVDENDNSIRIRIDPLTGKAEMSDDF